MSMEVSGILVAAHDLKAPLALVRQLALSLELAPDEKSRLRLQNQLVEVSERALREVNDLAKVARLEDGLFATEPVSVRGVCDEVLREISPLFSYENRAITPHYTNKSRLAVANRELLHSVIYNFCVNALRYSDAETTSQLKICEHKNKLRISVRDYGPALPSAVWQKLQSGALDQPTTLAMRPGSSGLGLYIASEFARHMHAKLGAVRHRDGASFFVDLPISQQAGLWG